MTTDKYNEEPLSPQAAPQTASVYRSINWMSVAVGIILSIGMAFDNHSVTTSVLSGVSFYGVIAAMLILWQPGALPYVLVSTLTSWFREVTERRRDEMQYKIHVSQAPQVSLVDPRQGGSVPSALMENSRFVPAIAPGDQSVEREAVAWVLQLYGKDGEPDPAKVLTEENTDKKDQVGRIRIGAPSKVAKQWLLDRRILFNMGTAYRLNLTRCPNIDMARQYLPPALNGVPYPTHPHPLISGGEGAA